MQSRHPSQRWAHPVRVPRRRATRRLAPARLSLVCAQPLLAMAVHAAPPAATAANDIAWSLPKGAVQTVLARHATLYGAPAHITYYEAPSSVSATIAHLRSHHPELGDLTVLQGMAVLSDRNPECLSTATVTGVGPARSAGTLSRVCWPAARSQSSAGPDWLPAGAQLAFDFSTQETAGRHRQQIWRHAEAPGVVRTAVRRNLLRSGWTPAPLDADGTQEWVRAAVVMAVDIVPAGSGSAIVTGTQFVQISPAPNVPQAHVASGEEAR